MREMVLNHASLRVAPRGRDQISDWLVGLAQGMAQLIERRVVRSALRMARPPYEIYCMDSYSLIDAYGRLRLKNNREEFLFLARLTSKLPLLQDSGHAIQERFLGCEGLSPPHDEGEPLVLCAITDWIAISFPTQPDWERNRLTVRFQELLSDGSLEETSKGIDNLARSFHATVIADQHHHRELARSNPVAFWENRRVAFRNLSFGPSVEDNLHQQARLFSVIVRKLVLLSKTANEWSDSGGSIPNWKTKVTPESDKVRDNPALLAKRRFPSQSGGTRIFDWHARYGNNGRIHLHFDPSSRVIEIGYIGPHLPL